MNNNKQTKKLLLLIAVLVVMALLLYSTMQLIEEIVLAPEDETVGFVSKTVVKDGVEYFPQQDITTVLVMGIDRYGPVTDSGTYNNHGAADMNLLIIIDDSTESVNLLYLNRDMMVEMPVLGLGGRKAGTYYGQLALAHTYGNGLEDSCENTRETISDLLGGVQIDYYVSMNMDAIAILNDAVGGVTVNVTDDFSQVDPTITMGEMTLHGEQAFNYVRTRKDVGDQLNLSRIERQKEYIGQFTESFMAAYEENHAIAEEVYRQVYPYLVTDMSVNVLSSMIEYYGTYSINRMVTPTGDNVMGEKYFEFYVHEDSLRDLSFELFYERK